MLWGSQVGRVDQFIMGSSSNSITEDEHSIIIVQCKEAFEVNLIVQDWPFDYSHIHPITINRSLRRVTKIFGDPIYYT